MTKEERDLLVKDLCARLPYDVRFPMKVWDDKEGKIVEKIAELDVYNKLGYAVGTIVNGPTKEYVGEVIKPYLFPLSSMTEEQKEKFNSFFASVPYYGDNEHEHVVPYYFVELLIEFFHENHIDNNGLIPKGLAIDATGKNIYEYEIRK